MAYIDASYYEEFIGESVYNADFPDILARASEIVEEMCMYRINESNLQTYPESIQKCFKNAICAQIEYMDANGGSDSDNGINIQSATLGKFSYTAAVNDGGAITGCFYSPRARRILAPTGLIYRGGQL